jgi:hypothetical protein
VCGPPESNWQKSGMLLALVTLRADRATAPASTRSMWWGFLAMQTPVAYGQGLQSFPGPSMRHIKRHALVDWMISTQ